MSGPCRAVSLRTMAVVDRMAQLNNEGKLPSPPPRPLASQEAFRRANASSPPPPSRVQGAQPPPGVQRVPRNAERRPHLPHRGCLSLTPRRVGAGNPHVRSRREVQGVSPCLFLGASKNIGGWAGGTTAQAKTIPPLKEGASHNKNPRAYNQRKPPVRLPSRVQGAQPPPGVQGVSPCFQKRWRVGRWDNGVSQAANRRQSKKSRNAG